MSKQDFLTLYRRKFGDRIPTCIRTDYEPVLMEDGRQLHSDALRPIYRPVYTQQSCDNPPWDQGRVVSLPFKTYVGNWHRIDTIIPELSLIAPYWYFDSSRHALADAFLGGNTIRDRMRDDGYQCELNYRQFASRIVDHCGKAKWKTVQIRVFDFPDDATLVIAKLIFNDDLR